MKQSINSCVNTLRVPCTPQVGCLSPCLVCLGFFTCANSLIGIADGVQMMVNDLSFREVQWVACVQSVLCEVWCSYITIRWCSASQCMRVRPVCLMYTLGHELHIWSTHTLLLLQWYWVFGVYLHVTEGAQWMRDHLDVQPCKICLTETSLM